jgi:hypothetical protein
MVAHPTSQLKSTWTPCLLNSASSRATRSGALSVSGLKPMRTGWTEPRGVVLEDVADLGMTPPVKSTRDAIGGKSHINEPTTFSLAP